MNKELETQTRERSPKFPSLTIPECLLSVEKLYGEAGRSLIDAEIAAKSIGYSGLNGASRTTLAAISGYGLLERHGSKHRISDLALHAIRPLSEEDKRSTLRKIFMTPPIFQKIAQEHPNCSESVLASILVRDGFTDEGAKRAARIFKDNFEFTEFNESFQLSTTVSNDYPQSESSEMFPSTNLKPLMSSVETSGRPRGTVLATFKIPLGLSEAELTFTGERLEPEDFDALTDYVAIFKKQYERKQRLSQPLPILSDELLELAKAVEE